MISDQHWLIINHLILHVAQPYSFHISLSNLEKTHIRMGGRGDRRETALSFSDDLLMNGITCEVSEDRITVYRKDQPK